MVAGAIHQIVYDLLLISRNGNNNKLSRPCFVEFLRCRQALVENREFVIPHVHLTL